MSRINHLQKFTHRAISFFTAGCFIISTIVTVPSSWAYEAITALPKPQTVLNLTSSFRPMTMMGLEVHPDQPMAFNVLIDAGDAASVDEDVVRDEGGRLIEYFLAALTVPDEDQWVNLSPQESDRIVDEQFGRTRMGRDLLAQDYVLKQLTASLSSPESDLGQRFWNKVYEKFYARTGKAPDENELNNRVWIVPDRAKVYEHANGVYILDRRLKVMLEEDYLGNGERGMVDNNTPSAIHQSPTADIKSIIRDTLIPAIEEEVNSGKHFANLRQIYDAMILAAWFKMRLKESLLGQSYMDKSVTPGVEHGQTGAIDQIYKQYLEAFRKGVYDQIREEYDPTTQQIIPRKYFSGGFDKALLSVTNLSGAQSLQITSDPAELADGLDGKRTIFDVRLELTAPGADNASLNNVVANIPPVMRSYLRGMIVAGYLNSVNALLSRRGQQTILLAQFSLQLVQQVFATYALLALTPVVWAGLQAARHVRNHTSFFIGTILLVQLFSTVIPSQSVYAMPADDLVEPVDIEFTGETNMNENLLEFSVEEYMEVITGQVTAEDVEALHGTKSNVTGEVYQFNVNEVLTHWDAVNHKWNLDGAPAWLQEALYLAYQRQADLQEKGFGTGSREVKVSEDVKKDVDQKRDLSNPEVMDDLLSALSIEGADRETFLVTPDGKTFSLGAIPLDTLPKFLIDTLPKPFRIGVTNSPIPAGQRRQDGINWKNHISDIKLLKATGNHVRTYTALNSKSYLDELFKQGVTVRVEIPYYDDTRGNANDQGVRQNIDFQRGTWKQYLQEYKDYLPGGSKPVITSIGLGNEYNYSPHYFGGDFNVFLQALEQFARDVHKAVPGLGVSTTWGDAPDMKWLRAVPSVDIHLMNVYAGDDPTIKLQRLQNMLDLLQWKREIGLGEIGEPSLKGQRYQATSDSIMLARIIAYAYTNPNFTEATFMTFADEWWKHEVYDSQGRLVYSEPNKQDAHREEHYGFYTVDRQGKQVVIVLKPMIEEASKIMRRPGETQAISQDILPVDLNLQTLETGTDTLIISASVPQKMIDSLRTVDQKIKDLQTKLNSIKSKAGERYKSTDIKLQKIKKERKGLLKDAEDIVKIDQEQHRRDSIYNDQILGLDLWGKKLAPVPDSIKAANTREATRGLIAASVQQSDMRLDAIARLIKMHRHSIERTPEGEEVLKIYIGAGVNYGPANAYTVLSIPIKKLGALNINIGVDSKLGYAMDAVDMVSGAKRLLAQEVWKAAPWMNVIAIPGYANRVLNMINRAKANHEYQGLRGGVGWDGRTTLGNVFFSSGSGKNGSKVVLHPILVEDPVTGKVVRRIDDNITIKHIPLAKVIEKDILTESLGRFKIKKSKKKKKADDLKVSDVIWAPFGDNQTNYAAWEKLPYETHEEWGEMEFWFANKAWTNKDENIFHYMQRGKSGEMIEVYDEDHQLHLLPADEFLFGYELDVRTGKTREFLSLHLFFKAKDAQLDDELFGHYDVDKEKILPFLLAEGYVTSKGKGYLVPNDFNGISGAFRLKLKDAGYSDQQIEDIDYIVLQSREPHAKNMMFDQYGRKGYLRKGQIYQMPSEAQVEEAGKRAEIASGWYNGRPTVGMAIHPGTGKVLKVYYDDDLPPTFKDETVSRKGFITDPSKQAIADKDLTIAVKNPETGEVEPGIVLFTKRAATMNYLFNTPTAPDDAGHIVILKQTPDGYYVHDTTQVLKDDVKLDSIQTGFLEYPEIKKKHSMEKLPVTVKVKDGKSKEEIITLPEYMTIVTDPRYVKEGEIGILYEVPRDRNGWKMRVPLARVYFPDRTVVLYDKEEIRSLTTLDMKTDTLYRNYLSGDKQVWADTIVSQTGAAPVSLVIAGLNNDLTQGEYGVIEYGINYESEHREMEALGASGLFRTPDGRIIYFWSNLTKQAFTQQGFDGDAVFTTLETNNWIKPVGDGKEALLLKDVQAQKNELNQLFGTDAPQVIEILSRYNSFPVDITEKFASETLVDRLALAISKLVVDPEQPLMGKAVAAFDSIGLTGASRQLILDSLQAAIGKMGTADAKVLQAAADKFTKALEAEKSYRETFGDQAFGQSQVGYSKMMQAFGEEDLKLKDQIFLMRFFHAMAIADSTDVNSVIDTLRAQGRDAQAFANAVDGYYDITKIMLVKQEDIDSLKGQIDVLIGALSQGDSIMNNIRPLVNAYTSYFNDTTQTIQQRFDQIDSLINDLENQFFGVTSAFPSAGQVDSGLVYFNDPDTGFIVKRQEAIVYWNQQLALANSGDPNDAQWMDVIQKAIEVETAALAWANQAVPFLNIMKQYWDFVAAGDQASADAVVAGLDVQSIKATIIFNQLFYQQQAKMLLEQAYNSLLVNYTNTLLLHPDSLNNAENYWINQRPKELHGTPDMLGAYAWIDSLLQNPNLSDELKFWLNELKINLMREENQLAGALLDEIAMTRAFYEAIDQGVPVSIAIRVLLQQILEHRTLQTEIWERRLEILKHLKDLGIDMLSPSAQEARAEEIARLKAIYDRVFNRFSGAGDPQRRILEGLRDVAEAEAKEAQNKRELDRLKKAVEQAQKEFEQQLMKHAAEVFAYQQSVADLEFRVTGELDQMVVDHKITWQVRTMVLQLFQGLYDDGPQLPVITVAGDEVYLLRDAAADILDKAVEKIRVKGFGTINAKPETVAEALFGWSPDMKSATSTPLTSIFRKVAVRGVWKDFIGAYAGTARVHIPGQTSGTPQEKFLMFLVSIPKDKLPGLSARMGIGIEEVYQHEIFSKQDGLAADRKEKVLLLVPSAGFSTKDEKLTMAVAGFFRLNLNDKRQMVEDGEEIGGKVDVDSKQWMAGISGVVGWNISDKTQVSLSISTMESHREEGQEIQNFDIFLNQPVGDPIPVQLEAGNAATVGEFGIQHDFDNGLSIGMSVKGERLQMTGPLGHLQGPQTRIFGSVSAGYHTLDGRFSVQAEQAIGANRRGAVIAFNGNKVKARLQGSLQDGHAILNGTVTVGKGVVFQAGRNVHGDWVGGVTLGKTYQDGSSIKAGILPYLDGSALYFSAGGQKRILQINGRIKNVPDMMIARTALDTARTALLNELNLLAQNPNRSKDDNVKMSDMQRQVKEMGDKIKSLNARIETANRDREKYVARMQRKGKHIMPDAANKQMNALNVTPDSLTIQALYPGYSETVGLTGRQTFNMPDTMSRTKDVLLQYQVEYGPAEIQRMMNLIRGDGDGLAISFERNAPILLTPQQFVYNKPIKYMSADELKKAGVFNDKDGQGYYILLKDNRGNGIKRYLGKDGATRLLTQDNIKKLFGYDAKQPWVVEATDRMLALIKQGKLGDGLVYDLKTGVRLVTEDDKKHWSNFDLRDGHLTVDSIVGYLDAAKQFPILSYADENGSVVELTYQGEQDFKNHYAGEKFALTLRNGEVLFGTPDEIRSVVSEYDIRWIKDKKVENKFYLTMAGRFADPRLPRINGIYTIAQQLPDGRWNDIETELNNRVVIGMPVWMEDVMEAYEELRLEVKSENGQAGVLEKDQLIVRSVRAADSRIAANLYTSKEGDDIFSAFFATKKAIEDIEKPQKLSPERKKELKILEEIQEEQKEAIQKILDKKKEGSGKDDMEGKKKSGKDDAELNETEDVGGIKMDSALLNLETEGDGLQMPLGGGSLKDIPVFTGLFHKIIYIRPVTAAQILGRVQDSMPSDEREPQRIAAFTKEEI